MTYHAEQYNQPTNQHPAPPVPENCIFGEPAADSAAGSFNNPTNVHHSFEANRELPEHASELEVPQWHMAGTLREIVVSGDRRPSADRTQVIERYGYDYGTLLAKVLLPHIPRPSLPEAAEVQRLANHTLLVFDSRRGQHAPPQYTIASEAAVRQVVAHRSVTRPARIRLSRDIITLHRGESLKIGRGHDRWLPREVRCEEQAIKPVDRDRFENTRVISDRQARFTVNKWDELILSSQGYNHLVVIAYPNQFELDIAAVRNAEERRLRRELEEARALHGISELAVVQPAVRKVAPRPVLLPGRPHRGTSVPNR